MQSILEKIQTAEKVANPFRMLTLSQLSSQNYVDRLACEMRKKYCASVRHLAFNSTPSSDLSARVGFSPLSQPALGLPSFPSMPFWLKMSSRGR